VLDDERFARLFVQDKRALEQWGAERIRRGLEARGVQRELIDRELAVEAADASLEVADPSIDVAGPSEPPDDERGRALALLRRRFPAPPRERRDRERALGVLLRKGYEYELALEALECHCAVHG
jgi:regulatory protein